MDNFQINKGYYCAYLKYLERVMHLEKKVKVHKHFFIRHSILYILEF